MASITSLMGSSSSTSIYGNSNTISGLASGMDTESMIENAVSGIKEKLEGYNKDRQKLEWEQEAYQSIIDKLIAFSDKFAPKYSDSSTDLLSAAFFRNATNVNTVGANKDMISAVGESISDIKITAVKMATYASYGGKGGIDLTDGTKTSLSSLKGQSFTIKNGDASADITIEENDTVEKMLAKINSSAVGVTATYSETTGQFFIKSKTTGTGDISIVDKDGGTAGADLFGKAENAYTTKGEKAKVSMVVNGRELTKEDYETNQITVDGMIISLKGDFGTIGNYDAANAVSFNTSVDSDKIVDTIKKMVEEFNTMANEIKDAYSTKPLKTSKGKRYEPLSEEDAKDMSESAVERYEEKAKTGLLFADNDLSALYQGLCDAANALGYANIGLSTEYDMSSGKTTLKLDEEKLRSTLEADPNKVKDVFTKGVTVKGVNGESTMHGMQMMQDTLQKYAKTVGEKGVLIKIAGSTKVTTSLNDNQYKSKLDNLDEVIKRWEEKLTKKIDYYTKQFTRLEKMISDANSQSSALMGFMGY